MSVLYAGTSVILFPDSIVSKGCLFAFVRSGDGYKVNSPVRHFHCLYLQKGALVSSLFHKGGHSTLLHITKELLVLPKFNTIYESMHSFVNIDSTDILSLVQTVSHGMAFRKCVELLVVWRV